MLAAVLLQVVALILGVVGFYAWLGVPAALLAAAVALGAAGWIREQAEHAKSGDESS